MLLELDPLVRAVAQLRQGLARLHENANDELVRDGVIQRFEYTYELCWKMLKRYLEMTEGSPSTIDEASFQDLIRLGSERGLLLHGWEEWRGYRTARASTSHTYDEAKAKEVLEQIPAFLEDAEYLLEALKARNA